MTEGVQPPAPDEDDLQLVVHEGDVLVTGPTLALDDFIGQIEAGGTHRDLVSRQSVSDMAAVASALAAVGMRSKDLVRLSPGSVQNLIDNRLIPGDPGFFRMVVRRPNGQFAGLQWQKVNLGPEQILALQTAAATMALRTAIASVEQAVTRVDGKVTRLLTLAKAAQVGDVLGHNRVLVRLVNDLDAAGRLTVTDWESVASLGPQLETMVERLRRTAIEIFRDLDPDGSAGDRLAALRSAVDERMLGETLQLLLIGEDSLYLWQRLRLQRVHDREPDSLDQVRSTISTQLREDAEADGRLVADLHVLLSNIATLQPLETLHRLTGRRLRTSAQALHADVSSFAIARKVQIDGWTDPSVPTVVDAGRVVKAVTQGVATEGGALVYDAALAALTGARSAVGATRQSFADRRHASGQADAPVDPATVDRKPAPSGMPTEPGASFPATSQLGELVDKGETPLRADPKP